MVRQNRNKRRGIQRGLEKYKIRNKIVEQIFNREPSKNQKHLGLAVAPVSRIAQASFDFLCRVSCTTHSLPMEYRDGKLFMSTSWKHLVTHYTWFAAASTFGALKTMIFASVLLEEGLTVKTLMSFALVSPFFFGLFLGSSIILKPSETL